jgi:dTDP-4-dehydrorhamnose reductase
MAEPYPAAVYATRAEIDITDYWRMTSEMERIRPTVVVNTAAFTHVDGCEDQPENADLVNHVAAGHVARAASQAGARLIHVSTDFVFDGSLARPHVEEDPASPISVYGRTKLEGELAVRRECAEATIVRTSWLFGHGKGKFPENFLSMVSEGRELSIVADRFGTPTFIPDLAEAIVRLIPRPHPGVLNFTNRGEKTSRYHLILRAAEGAGLDTSKVRPISRSEWKGDRAPRPDSSALDPTRFIELTGWSPPTWEEAVDTFILTRGS